jgi:hypothetical protein
VTQTFTRMGSGQGLVDVPIVRYSMNGQEQELRARMGTRPSPWAVGEAVDVLYDPDTGRAELAGGKLWIPSLRYLLIGLTTLLLGLGVRRLSWERSRSSP